jgi:uncharacterized protein YbgA (DUF1722 family)
MDFKQMREVVDIVQKAQDDTKFQKAKTSTVDWCIKLTKSKSPQEKIDALLHLQDYLGQAFVLKHVDDKMAELKEVMPDDGFATVVLPIMLIAKLLMEIDRAELAEKMGDK